MSVEARLLYDCPHLVVEEVATVQADRRTLQTRAPVANSRAVRILVNDEFYVPSGGLYSQAQLVSEFPGPYRLDACNNVLSVQGKDIILPANQWLTAEAVALLLQPELPTVVVESVRDTLVLTEAQSVGRSSRLQVGGGAVSALGFSSQRGSQGRQVYPGWGLSQEKVPVFQEPLRGAPILKVSYVTETAQCPRCGGVGAENDVRFSPQGDMYEIRDENLLYQAALKILLTKIQSNPYHPQYGSPLESRIGTKAVGATVSLLTQDVRRVMANFQALQTEQAKYQPVTLKERLYSVNSIRVVPYNNDPSAFLVSVGVLNAAGGQVDLNVVYRTPSVGVVEDSLRFG